jgi:hypothetical protein
MSQPILFFSFREAHVAAKAGGGRPAQLLCPDDSFRSLCIHNSQELKLTLQPSQEICRGRIDSQIFVFVIAFYLSSIFIFFGKENEVKLWSCVSFFLRTNLVCVCSDGQTL